MKGNYITSLRLVVLALLIVQIEGLLWPLPQQLENGQDVYTLSSSSFQFLQSGNGSDLISRAFDRYGPLIFYNGNGDNGQNDSVLSSLEVVLVSNSEDLQLGVDESYSLNIQAPQAVIKAQTPFGALRGLEAFSQLVFYNSSLETYTISDAPISIVDYPRFPHRGLLIDSSRHFQPIENILRTVDALAYNKMNVLHWHLTDAESFPVESFAYPDLTKGAWSPDEIYTQQNITAVIQYGLDRGIRILPEFDSPGHTDSWGAGYPITTWCPKWSQNVNNVPLSPAHPQTMPLVKGFLTEMAQLFSDNFMHIGGDEVEYICWKQDSNLSAWMSENGISSYNALMQYYENQVWQTLSGQGKSMIAWEEVFNGYDLDIPEDLDIIIEVWKDEPTLLSVAQANLRGILAYGWYLDNLQMNWEDFYLFEPFNSSDWTPSLEQLIVGGEAACWGEQVSFANLDQTVWPRTSSVAERLWSNEGVTDITSATVRIEDHICRMNRRGIMSGPIAPGFCP